MSDPANLTADPSTDGIALSCAPSTTPGVTAYWWFRRTPANGTAFDPAVDTPIATTTGTSHLDDTAAFDVEYEFQVFGKLGGGTGGDGTYTTTYQENY